MEIKKIKHRFRVNGIMVTEDAEDIRLTPIPKSTIQYVGITLIFLPVLGFVVFVTGFSILGLFILVAGISMLYNGYKSWKEVERFNSYSISISRDRVRGTELDIEKKAIKKVLSTRNTNPLFPNCDIAFQTESEKIVVLKIWNKKSKYLNEDRFEVVKMLYVLMDVE